MRTVLVIALSLGLIMSGLGPSAGAIDFVRVNLGISASSLSQQLCELRRNTSKWAANDWNTVVMVYTRNDNANDVIGSEVTAPSGKVFGHKLTIVTGSPNTICRPLFVPILGTDAETWQGAWRASILLNGKKVTEVSWEVTPPRPEALREYQASLAANPSDPSPRAAHYRVGAAAALAGQDELAETELKEAIRLGSTWPFPPLALGRLYQRQGKRELALEQFRLLKAMIASGRVVEEGSFTGYILAMTEDHLKQLEP